MSQSRAPEWLSANDAVVRIAELMGGERAAQDLIADWIGEGKLPAKARAIERFPSNFDNGGDDDLSLSEALKRGFVKLDSLGVKFGSLRLTDRFWGESRDWQTDYSHWNWDRGDFVVGYRDQEGVGEPSYWLAKRVHIKTRPFDTLFAVWKASTAPTDTSPPSKPAQQRKGRKEDPRRADWTGEVVLMVLKKHIHSSMTANELIIEVERRLTEKGIWGEGGIEAPDRTTVYKSAQRVIQVLESARSEPA